MSSALELDRHEAVAKRILDAASADVDEVEVHVDGAVESFVRFADVGPTQCADRDKVGISLRVRKRGAEGWREACAVVGSLEEGDWRHALGRALALVEHSPENPAALELPSPQTVETVSHSSGMLEHGIQGKLDWVERSLRAGEAAGVAPAGLARTEVCATTVANSHGLLARGSRGRASLSLTATGLDASGIGQSTTYDPEHLDVERVIQRATEKAIAGARPERMAPSETTVVLDPLAVSALLLFATYHGFGAREVEEGSSFLAERSGQQLFAPELSIHDDARHSLLGALPFDGEGVPRQRVALVDGGRLGLPVTDRVHARRMGLPCTGHSPRRPSEDGPKADALVVAPGKDSFDELVRGVEDGLLVSQFHYTNLIEPRELTLTGMTRNGTFRIRNGEIVGAVQNLRFTQELTKALGRVSGITREQELVSALFGGEVATPALRIDGFRFTSTSDF